jgi:O-methyltransferase
MDITKCESHLADFDMRVRLQNQAMQQLYLKSPAPTKFENVELLYDFVCEQLAETPATYLEFGVSSGATMRRFAARLRHPGSRFYGFDCFDGLPEDWPVHGPRGVFPKGAFSTRGSMPKIEDARVELIKGYFQNTLPPFLAGGNVGGPNPHIVHYDADLYSATLFIATTLWHHLPDYFFVMDEFCYDEIVALRDFVLSYPVSVAFLAQCGDKLFGRVVRVPFAP